MQLVAAEDRGSTLALNYHESRSVLLPRNIERLVDRGSHLEGRELVTDREPVDRCCLYVCILARHFWQQLEASVGEVW